MQISKSKLKEPNGYYYEQKPWHETLPDMLDVPEFKTEIFPKPMTHTEILETYKIIPYASYALAAGVIASIIPDLKNSDKGRIVYFKENDVLYRFDAFRDDDGGLDWRVNEVVLGRGWDAGCGACFGNSPSDSEPSDSSILGSFVPHAPKIIKEYCYCEKCEQFYKEWVENKK